MAKPDTGAAVQNEDPAVEETEKAPEAAKADGKASERRKDDRNEGPQPNTPRWNEVYGKWKDTSRRLEEREKDVEAIREHNRALEARLVQLERTKADRPSEPEPDPAVDPDAYKKFHEMKRLREREEWDKQRRIDRHEMQVEMQKELHGEEEYLAMIKVTERDMAKDPELKKKIWESGNPPKEAYKYGEKRTKEMQQKDQEEETREKARKQVETEPSGEGGTESPDQPEERLSEDEIRVCRNLFPDLKIDDAKKKYLKQKKAMGRS